MDRIEHSNIATNVVTLYHFVTYQHYLPSLGEAVTVSQTVTELYLLFAQPLFSYLADKSYTVGNRAI